MRNLRFLPACIAQVVALAFALFSSPGHARVTRIVIDKTTPMATPGGSANAGIAYEQIAGRAFGELDPKLPNDATALINAAQASAVLRCHFI